MVTRIFIAAWCLLVTISLASGCRPPQTSVDPIVSQDIVPDRAEDICPILIGQLLPEITLTTSDHEPFDVNEAVKEKPTVIIFYRGGWCPFCNLHLGQLQEIESELVEMGWQIFAVSPDRSEILNGPAEEHDLTYRLLSDSEMTAARALGIAFRVDETTIARYKSNGIDLEGDSGQKHHLLPVPSAFLVGQDGIIQYTYVNPNYRVRIDPGVLLEAAKAMMR